MSPRLRSVVIAMFCISWCAVARADDGSGSAGSGSADSGSAAPADDGIDDDAFLIKHPHSSWWLSAQVNSIAQAQPGFHSPYQGTNSFRSEDHFAISFVETVYVAYELTPYTAIEIAPESAGGTGLSSALGLAGFTNLDVVRNPSLGVTPYIGRAEIVQIIPLSQEMVTVQTPMFNVLRRVPVRRIAVRAGKISTVDSFDNNSIGTDSHLQLMNWSVDNNGAYDYAADTRGYTLGGVAEYIDRQWALRYGFALMPTVANGIDYDYHLAQAHGQQIELELHSSLLGGRPGIARLLAYQNSADMGNYKTAIAIAAIGESDLPSGTTPDITQTRQPGRTKRGYGLNLEQQLPANIRVYSRLGWSDGQNESFAYTEIDNTISAGADMQGNAWCRPHDRVGLAAVTNGLSTPHREYLALGGDGFILGDGKLNYGREDIVEAYYTARAYRGVSPAIDLQFIEHPGYNADRGPVVVGSLRLHVEL